jgi:hypothetical protein
MRMLAALALPPLIAGASVPDGPFWAAVPASRAASVTGSIAVPDEVTGEVIRFVGPTGSGGGQKAVSRRVFTVEVSSPAAEATSASGVTDQAVPAGAYWPDAHDRIAVSPLGPGAPQGAPAIRNPWEVRARPRGPGEETVIACGGIIGGGDGGPVALLNGRVLRRGDTLGQFSVARVLVNEVVLERNGSFVVIPRGRRVTVSVTAR